MIFRPQGAEKGSKGREGQPGAWDPYLSGKHPVDLHFFKFFPQDVMTSGALQQAPVLRQGFR